MFRTWLPLLFIVLLVSCAPHTAEPQEEQKQLYTLSQDTPENASCASTSYDSLDNNSYNASLRAVLVDATTQLPVAGYARMTLGNSGGSLSTDNTYSCFESVSATTALVSVFASGYTPVAFSMDVPKNAYTTVTVPMYKSCTGAQSCFDVMQINGLSNETYEQTQQAVEGILSLNKSAYTLTCLECDIGRAGFIKGKAQLTNGSEVSFYKRTGWCSSGGSDCGYDLCVSGDGPVVQAVATATCAQVHTSVLDTNQTGGIAVLCGGVPVDTSNETQAACLAGAFTQDGTFSVRVQSNRCGSAVLPGKTHCLE
jgi:hypothetical protein